MNLIFADSQYVLKRHGLSIFGKYRLYDLQNNPLLYIEEQKKLIPPSTTIHLYGDEKKGQEILTIKDNSADGVDFDVLDVASGQKIGALTETVDDASDLVKDKWSILDADNNVIGKMSEKSAGHALVREHTEGAVPQKLSITVGNELAAELRQKVTLLGYQLTIDFSPDSANKLDRRLGIAAAVLAALHQGQES